MCIYVSIGTRIRGQLSAERGKEEPERKKKEKGPAVTARTSAGGYGFSFSGIEAIVQSIIISGSRTGWGGYWLISTLEFLQRKGNRG